VHGVDEHGFDLGTGELLAGAGQDDGVVIRGPATVALDDDVPDLSALQSIGQINLESAVGKRMGCASGSSDG
jgi:hypothetical protein